MNWQGAALVSRDGKLLGIGSLAVGNAIAGNTAVPGNMFVPIDVLKPVIGDFIANGKSTSQPRPWLGITSQEVGGNLLVARVSPEGPADDAGLKAGDIIVGIAGDALRGKPISTRACGKPVTPAWKSRWTCCAAIVWRT